MTANLSAGQRFIASLRVELRQPGSRSMTEPPRTSSIARCYVS
jgi:hypothetical protein